ncbi:hypothetical protein [Paraburkholderia gardini]|uniref:hypothetical protein n=1 Tax=Paraburkholderia gardini TaxID=2823469 RepID=UPI001DEBD941|nr:hypothetical protein [Paraburkholderia gardini]CAG4926980.1 hypothetical protein R69919_05465 [Paraburkholderia gardini]
MNTRETSLRRLVERWFGPDPAMRARVTMFSHAQASRWRYVCVASGRPSGELSIFFFRHEDGSWSVFPPETRRATMNVARMPVLPGVPGPIASTA